MHQDEQHEQSLAIEESVIDRGCWHSVESLRAGPAGLCHDCATFYLPLAAIGALVEAPPDSRGFTSSSSNRLSIVDER